MKEQPPGHTPEQLADLVERQRRQQENIDWLNAQAPRPATWTIGKQLGELPLAIGIVSAITKRGPRKETHEEETTQEAGSETGNAADIP